MSSSRAVASESPFANANSSSAEYIASSSYYPHDAPPSSTPAFGWGLPPGLAPPDSHTLFAAHQASALDEPGLPLPTHSSLSAAGVWDPQALPKPVPAERTISATAAGSSTNSTPTGAEGADAAFSMHKQLGALPPFETESAVQAQLLYYQRLAAEQQLALQEQLEVQRQQALQLELLSRTQLQSSNNGASAVASSRAQCNPVQPHRQELPHINITRLSETELALNLSGAQHSNDYPSGTQPSAFPVAPAAAFPRPLPGSSGPCSMPVVQSFGVQLPSAVPLPQESAGGSVLAPPAPPPLLLQHQQQHVRPISGNIYVPSQPMPEMAHQQLGVGQGLGSSWAGSIPDAGLSGSPAVPHILQESSSPSQWSRANRIAQLPTDPHIYETSPRTEFADNVRQAPDAFQMRAFDPNVMAQAAAYTSQNLGHPQAGLMRRTWGSSLPPLAHPNPTASAVPQLPPNLLQNPVVYAEQLRVFTAAFEASLMAPLGGGHATIAMQTQALSMAQQHLQQQIAAQQLAAQQGALRLLRAQGTTEMPPVGSIYPSAGGGMAAMQLRGDTGSKGSGSSMFSVPEYHQPVPALSPLPNLSQLMSHRSHLGSDIHSGGSSPSAMSRPASASMPTPKKVKVIISAGGCYVKPSAVGTGVIYQGGETRLMQLSWNATFADVLESLDRVAGSSVMSSGSAGFAGPVASLKYQLPSAPTVYVDVLDDEDVLLMLDEWHEAVANGSSGLRLHIFVEWRSPQLKGSIDSVDTLNADKSTSAGSVEGRATSVELVRPSRPSGSQIASSQRVQFFAGLAERMEIIHPKDIQLSRFLGAGGYGEVYLGKWHGSEVAVKCLNPGLFFGGGEVNDHAAVAELVREADMLGSLRHPNVVWVYGMVLPPPPQDTDDGVDSGDREEEEEQLGSGAVRPPAIVTEYMSGGSLHNAIARKAEMVQDMLPRLMVALDAAKGMEYLHAKGIVHFDMKSANLLLGHRDRRVICKVADFGLSKQKQQTYVSGITSSRGTLPWIAPEIIKSPEAVTEKVDVYSFGVVLWELWTFREPFEGLNYHALLHQMTSAGVRVRPPIPGTAEWDASDGEPPPEPTPGYQDLIERCWNERPQKRPTFQDIVRDLAAGVQALRYARRSQRQVTRKGSPIARNTSQDSLAAPPTASGGKR